MKIYQNSSRDRFYSSCALSLLLYILLMFFFVIIYILEWIYLDSHSESFVTDIVFATLVFVFVPLLFAFMVGGGTYLTSCRQRYEVFLEEGKITISSSMNFVSTIYEFEVSNIISINKFSYFPLINSRNIIVKVKGYSTNGYFHRTNKARITLIPVCSKEDRKKIINILRDINPSIEIKGI